MKALWAFSGAISLLWVGAALAAPLCTRYTIKEPVPRTFKFQLGDGTAATEETFRLRCQSDFGNGDISCARLEEGTADCRVTDDPSAEVVVKLDLDSSDPDQIGSIVSGFRSGGFYIGRGGWTLRCL